MGASRDWTIYERQKSQNNVNIGIIRTNYSILYTSILFVLNIRPKRHHKRKKEHGGNNRVAPLIYEQTKLTAESKEGPISNSQILQRLFQSPYAPPLPSHLKILKS